MATLLDSALAYASIGWRVMPLHNIESGICTCRPSEKRPKAGAECPSPGKHPRIKTGRAFEAATTDPDTIRNWWRRWPNANIGIATGQASKLCIVDLDGREGVQLLESLKAHGEIPQTLAAASGRDGIGAHLYFFCDEPSPSNSGGKLDIRGDGGLVVAPPSMHLTGRPYAWLNAGVALARMPPWLLHWFRNREGHSKRPEVPSSSHLPEHLRNLPRTGLLERVLRAEREPVDLADIASALAAIPNGNRSWDAWNRIGMAVWAACDGAEGGQILFDRWSQGSGKYNPGAAEERWRAYAGTPPTSIGFGSLWYEARQANPAWSPPSRYVVENVQQQHQQFQEQVNPFGVAPEALNGHGLNGHHLNGDAGPAASLFKPRGSDNPLIELNERFSVIGNLGGKCVVLEWVQSKADESVKIPSFQSFKSFSERFAHRYIDYMAAKKNKEGETELAEKTEQLGTYWLKWHGRLTYEGMDLDPSGEPVLPGNVLNLWKGFGVEPRAGKWPLMQRHVFEVLASGSEEQATYILRWAAWAVQNPADQAEVALVFKGDKGSGKGTFANAIRRLFGQHGLQIFSSKHLVGQFNAHLRNCLLLFADEAFWAGDKQGESTLKGLITERTLAIEQKGVDLVQTTNRLHVIMSANADWVVPASHDERRYAVFDVDSRRARDKAYFTALNAELDNGGLEAMLYDLQRMPLGDWHPRTGVQTLALQKQKEASLNPLTDWYLGVLQDGYMPGGREGRVPAAALLHMARDSTGRLRDLSPQALGRFLRKQGLTPVHAAAGQFWEFPPLPDLRKGWEKQFGPWAWDSPDLKGWRSRV